MTNSEPISDGPIHANYFYHIANAILHIKSDIKQSLTQLNKILFYMENGHPEREAATYLVRSSVRESTLAHILTPALRKIVHLQQWKLGDRQYRDLNAKMLFQILEEAKMNVLWVDLNKKAAIIKQISTPRYPHLKALYLGDNNIASIEMLGALEAPNLEKLYLNHNKLVCLKSMTRTYFPQLTQLNLYGNFIEDESSLAQCLLPKAEKLNLSYPDKKQKIFHSHWFMKAQFTDTATIRSSKSRLSPVLTRNAFLSMMESVTQDRDRSQPKDLFKTFEK